eukprot:6519666-Pyramimonas_sp.AAC.1
MRAQIVAVDAETNSLNKEVVETLPSASAASFDMDSTFLDDHPHGARIKEFMYSQSFKDFIVVPGEFNKSKVKTSPQPAASPFVGTGTARPRS